MTQTNQPADNDTTLPRRISQVDFEATLDRMRDREYPRLCGDEFLRRLERQADRQISDRWYAVIEAMGRRYAESKISTFKTHGTDVEITRQQLVLERLSKLCERLVDHTSYGGGLFLCGPVGTGKDHLMAAMLREAVLVNEQTATWVNGQDLTGDFRDAISQDRSEASIVGALCRHDILAISDVVPPRGETSAYGTSLLYRVIDRRYRNRKSIWTTINVSTKEEAERRLTPPIADRLIDGAVVCECNWSSYRKKAT